ncbi:hypothetical protein AURDEDRAFT_67342 [Auricularia subglabra TFB-10046 SS5]|nr:hypothetical protein AURDEDRAFT_67342 [Auricularia subglabra TFB-10046 SS5]
MLSGPVADEVLRRLLPFFRSLQPQPQPFPHPSGAIPQAPVLQGTSNPASQHAANGVDRGIPAPSTIPTVTRRRTVTIHGVDVSFNYHELPEPPALPVGGDIAELAAHWGDIAAEWHSVKHRAYLYLGSSPIPILYWRPIYMGWKGLNDRRWELLKGRWIQWMFLVKEYRASGSISVFWERFTVEGRRLPITRVVKTIKDARNARNKRIADFARDYCLQHGENFDKVMEYRKGSSMVVPVKNHVIARHWQKLGRPMPADVGDVSDDDAVEE